VHYTLDCKLAADGRWMAEVLELRGAMARDSSRGGAMIKAETLALRDIAEHLAGLESARTSLQTEAPLASDLHRRSIFPSLKAGKSFINQ
jgi:hypothetical protein